MSGPAEEPGAAAVRRYYEAVAPEWDRLRARYGFYHAQMRRLVGGMVPPGARVLEIGCGTGDLLAALRPSRGVGLNVAEALTLQARRKHPDLEFRTAGVDAVDIPDGFKPEYVVMTNFVDYVYDMWDLARNLAAACAEGALLVITTNNPLWVPFLRFAGRLGARMPDPPRNMITNMDIKSVLKLQGFDTVEEGLALPVPVRVPLAGGLLNALLPELPVLRYASSVQYIAARPRKRRPRLSCSVVVPCYNEADNILRCIDAVPELGAGTEIVVVDDGSSDGTGERVRERAIRDRRVKLVSFEANRGKAAAVRAGFQAATGDALLVLDADMTVEPGALRRFVEALENGAADFVNGTRLVYPMAGKAMRFANFLGNKAFCYLASWILRQRVSDTLCGTKAMLRKDFERMAWIGRDRWGDFALLFGAAKLKLRILELPVHYQARRSGVSKMRVLKDGALFLMACWLGWRLLRFPPPSKTAS